MICRYTLEDIWKINGWNIKITQLKRNIIFQTFIIVFHVNFQGCTNDLGSNLLLSLKKTFREYIHRKHSCFADIPSGNLSLLSMFSTKVVTKNFNFPGPGRVFGCHGWFRFFRVSIKHPVNMLRTAPPLGFQVQPLRLYLLKLGVFQGTQLSTFTKVLNAALLFELVVSTHLKNISQIGSFPQGGVRIKNL